jgi:hypothetical protein
VIFPIRLKSGNGAGYPIIPGFVKSSGHRPKGLPVAIKHSKGSSNRKLSNRDVFLHNKSKRTAPPKKSTNRRDQCAEPAAYVCPWSLAAEPRALLRIINVVFKTDCRDPAAVDVNGTWAIILEELSPYYQSALTLAVRFHPGMTLSKAGKILGVSGTCVHQRCDRAIRFLRGPHCVSRIRSSIVGIPNLYRNQ